MKILTIGTFDIPHIGHYSFLSRIHVLFPEAKIVVAVNSDEFVARFKGNAPVFTQDERMDLLSNIEFIRVTENGFDENAGLVIDTIQPDVLAIGSDWARKDYMKQLGITQDFLDEREINLIYIPYTENISTSEIKKRLQ